MDRIQILLYDSRKHIHHQRRQEPVAGNIIGDNPGISQLKGVSLRFLDHLQQILSKDFPFLCSKVIRKKKEKDRDEKPISGVAVHGRNMN